ncbi:MAG: TolC family protein [Labilithrix sp.]|nr:TolC family protein [Labilithrix sp.]
MRSFASIHAEPASASVIPGVGRAHTPSIPRSSARRSVYATLLFLAASVVASPAAAQPARPEQPTPASPPTPAGATAPEAPAADMTAAVPGGITAEQVGARAAATSYQAKAAAESASAATARADAAWSNYLPKLGLKASYTRLSEFTAPSFGGSGAIVGTTAPAGSCVANCPPGVPSVDAPLFGVDFKFPLIFNQWLTQATIAIPISDYFLRINQAHTAATKQSEAARWDIATARAKSFSDGKVAYFTWLRARAAMKVAEQNLAVAEAHVKDAQNQFAVGNASKADVLRAETQVAAASLLVERAKSGIVITERQVRVATHAKEEERLEPGESLDSTLPPTPQNVRALVSEALGARPEIKSVDKNAEATRKLAEVQRAGNYPVLAGYGDVTYANPNQRRIPQTQDWFPTWALGAQITWSPNDLVAAGPQAADLESRASALEAQKYATRDGIELEVTQAYQAVIEADTAITTTTQQLASAEEGYRVARELFNAGRGTATTLIDAETALAQTRFEHLNAKVDARLARIRLEHAVGRDVK